jgi:hypothetical protein
MSGDDRRPRPGRVPSKRPASRGSGTARLSGFPEVAVERDDDGRVLRRRGAVGPHVSEVETGHTERMPAVTGAALRVRGLLDADDASEGSLCDGILEDACTDAPRNFALNAANGACTKTAEQLASPGVVLPPLLAAVGAPVGLAGALATCDRGGRRRDRQPKG